MNCLRIHYTESDALKEQFEAAALTLALQYNFVTELTSLIVVQDEGNGNFTPSANQGLDFEDLLSGTPTTDSV